MNDRGGVGSGKVENSLDSTMNLLGFRKEHQRRTIEIPEGLVQLRKSNVNLLRKSREF